MSAVVTTAYWRAAGASREKTKKICKIRMTNSPLLVAGMSYVKYANLCAEMVRVSLKEPFLTKVSCLARAHPVANPRGHLSLFCAPSTQAKPRETVYFKSTLFEAGKPQKSGAFPCDEGSSTPLGAAITALG